MSGTIRPRTARPREAKQERLAFPGPADESPYARWLRAGPRIPPAPRLAPFPVEAAVRLLRENPVALGPDGGAQSGALRALVAAAGQDASRVVNRLWEAREEGLLSDSEKSQVEALARLHDG